MSLQNIPNVKDAKGSTIQSMAAIKTTTALYAPKTIPQDYISAIPAKQKARYAYILK
jgi:hypothetical protein